MNIRKFNKIKNSRQGISLGRKCQNISLLHPVKDASLWDAGVPVDAIFYRAGMPDGIQNLCQLFYLNIPVREYRLVEKRYNF